MLIVPRPRPPRSALLVVAHGDGGPDPRDIGTRQLTARLSERLAIPVACAMLRRPETVAAARATLFGASELWPAGERDLIVYPFFMTEGWFVREKLPKVLTAAGFSDWLRLDPFGSDPALIDYLDRKLTGIAARAGRDRDTLNAVLIAHGSASGEAGSRLGTEAIRDRLAERGWGNLSVGFIEEEPFYDALIAERQPEAVIGLFVTSGTHAVNDVAGIVARTPSVREHVLAVGLEEEVVDWVMRQLDARLGEAIAPFVITPES
jgi:sirohydrochlorin ferrochelatase